MGCNYLSLPLIPASGAQVLIPSISFRNFAFCPRFVLVCVIYVFQDDFTGIGTIIWLALCQWINLEEHGLMNQLNLPLSDYITPTKQNTMKLWCWFWGIYWVQSCVRLFIQLQQQSMLTDPTQHPTMHRAANQYRTSVFCMDFTCKIREYEFGLQNTEIELCQFCHLKYCCQNKAYLFLGSNSVKFCGILCLKTFKYLFNHQNIQSSLFHMW